MTAANLPILYLNILDSLPSDLGQAAFLWATERPQNDRACYVAEDYAREVELLVQTLGGPDGLHSMGFALHAKDLPIPADSQADLMRFVLVRHANYRFGGNLNALPFLDNGQRI